MAKIFCTCDSSYQDKKYGKQIRIMNLCKDLKYRCTICGNKKG